MRYGLSEAQLQEVLDIITSDILVERVVLFGSRAMGNYKEASDIDIALDGEGVDARCAIDIHSKLEDETYLPFLFDIIALPTVANDEFVEHIRREGIVLYERGGLVSRGWIETTLGELLILISKGTTPSTTMGGFTDNGINYIKSDAISYTGRIDTSRFVKISPATHDILERSQLQANDILLSMAGAYLGKSGIVSQKMLPANTNQAVAILRANEKIVIPEFIGYYFRIPNTIELINNVSGQSAQPNINFGEIKSLKILLPPLEEQRAIAEVLGSLDDKIDLLHRQNETLESLAGVLFRHWFIECARPDWETKTLDEVAHYLNGLACQKHPAANEKERLRVLKIKELKGGMSDHSDWATSDVAHKYVVENGDVIFAWSASLLVKIWDGEDCVLNQHLFKVTSENYPKWFYYFWTQYHLQKFIMIAASKATTMGHIKRGDITNSPVFIPDEKSLEEGDKSIAPLISRKISNNVKIRTLEELRDALLPKLMNASARIQLAPAARS